MDPEIIRLTAIRTGLSLHFISKDAKISHPLQQLENAQPPRATLIIKRRDSP